MDEGPLVQIMAEMVGGEGAEWTGREMREISHCMGYEPGGITMVVAEMSGSDLTRFADELPGHSRGAESTQWAWSLARSGMSEAYLDPMCAARFYRRLGLFHRHSTDAAHDHFSHFDASLRRVYLRASPVMVRIARWQIHPAIPFHVLRFAIQRARCRDLWTGYRQVASALLSILRSFYLSTEGLPGLCERVTTRVSEEMASWLCHPGCAPGSDYWSSGCATIYRANAMCRLAHADRARLAMLIQALVSAAPYDLVYPIGLDFPEDPARYFRPEPRGPWDEHVPHEPLVQAPRAPAPPEQPPAVAAPQPPEPPAREDNRAETGEIGRGVDPLAQQDSGAEAGGRGDEGGRMRGWLAAAVAAVLGWRQPGA